MRALRSLGIYFGVVEPTEGERAVIESESTASRLREAVAVADTALLLGACLAALSNLSITRALIFGFGLSLALAVVARLRR